MASIRESSSLVKSSWILPALRSRWKRYTLRGERIDGTAIGDGGISAWSLKSSRREFLGQARPNGTISDAIDRTERAPRVGLFRLAEHTKIWYKLARSSPHAEKYIIQPRRPFQPLHRSPGRPRPLWQRQRCPAVRAPPARRAGN